MGRKKKQRDGGVYLEYPGIDEKKYIIYPDGTVIITETGEIKKQWKSGNGYLYIDIYSNSENKCYCVSIHRLLALHFLPKTEEDIKHERKLVHFKDFDKDNITLDNLEWINLSELMIKTEIRYNDFDSIKDYARHICILLSKGYKRDEICRVLEVPSKKYAPFIGKIQKRQIYKDISKKYKF